MKAVMFKKNKSRLSLSYCETNIPIPKDDEVLVKVSAVALNANDYRLFHLSHLGIGVPKSKIFGNAFSGTVEMIGKNVQRFRIGDCVVADTSDTGFGGMAEYAVASERVVEHKPKGISFEAAAALPVAATTALNALRKGNVTEGQEVLINGASGGVGTYAIQLAKNYGAVVTAVCSTQNMDTARRLGADFVIDYTKVNFTTETKQYDFILAVNGYHPLSAYKRALKTNGIYVMVGGTFTQIFKSLLLGPLMSGSGKKMRSLIMTDTTDLAFLLEMVESGKLVPIIDRIYPLYEGVEAFSYIAAGHSKGKVIIQVENELNLKE